MIISDNIFHPLIVCEGNTNLLIWISHPEGGTQSSQPGICLQQQ